MLEPRLPLELEIVPRVVDSLVEGRGFGGTSPVVLEFILCLFPRVAPEHTGLFGEVRLVGVLELVRSTDRDSGQASGRAMCLQFFSVGGLLPPPLSATPPSFPRSRAPEQESRLNHHRPATTVTPVQLLNMARKGCQKLQSVKLVSSPVLSGVGDDVILY